ncbi:MAG: hypothetical protein JWL77_432 [Chthonomonadaceae bacterium]|nr:hypothetical protein [Chthonomonadaceae bacterium]
MEQMLRNPMADRFRLLACLLHEKSLPPSFIRVALTGFYQGKAIFGSDLRERLDARDARPALCGR